MAVLSTKILPQAHESDDYIRLANGPIGSAEITVGQSSPAKSVHPSMLVASVASLTSLVGPYRRHTTVGTQPESRELASQAHSRRCSSSASGIEFGDAFDVPYTHLSRHSSHPSPKTRPVDLDVGVMSVSRTEAQHDGVVPSAMSRPSTFPGQFQPSKLRNDQSDTEGASKGIRVSRTVTLDESPVTIEPREIKGQPPSIRPIWQARRSISAPVRTKRHLRIDISAAHSSGLSERIGTPWPPRHAMQLLLFIESNKLGHRRRMAHICLVGSNNRSLSTIEEQRNSIHPKSTAPADFDDATLFRLLRTEAKALLGNWSLYGARKIGHIKVHGDASLAADAAFGWVRSPGSLPWNANSYTEEQLYLQFLHPELGEARYAWVHWARSVAFAANTSTVIPEVGDNSLSEIPSSSAPHPVADLEAARIDLRVNGVGKASGMTNVEGLEFVLVWNARKICNFVGLVTSISVVIFFAWVSMKSDKETKAWSSDRVGDAFSFACYFFLVGQTLVVAWLCMSYLRM